MPVIALQEYGRLHIGELDPGRPSVTASHADVLLGLSKVYGFDVFKCANRTALSAQQYVGTVQVGNLAVDILPKVEGIDGTTMCRNLVGMLSVARDIDIGEGDVARVATQQLGILEILIRLFCDKLFAQIHRGMARRYESREENLPMLRGKLGVVEQVRLNASHPERFYCRYDEFCEDNALNQILKAALRLLLKATRDVANQRKVSELLLVFEDVSDVPIPQLAWSKVSLDRLSKRFEPTFRLAELFLKGRPPDVSAGGAPSFSLLFDMNTLFEEYVGRVAARVFRPLGYQVNLQSPHRYLAYDEATDSDAFQMKPDVVALKGPGVEWIVDTKWKELSLEKSKEGVVQADVYQMNAYAGCYECRDVVLLYPHHAGLGATAGQRASYRLHRGQTGAPPPHSPSRIRIATLDLTDLRTVPSQLKALLHSAEEDALVA